MSISFDRPDALFSESALTNRRVSEFDMYFGGKLKKIHDACQIYINAVPRNGMERSYVHTVRRRRGELSGYSGIRLGTLKPLDPRAELSIVIIIPCHRVIGKNGRSQVSRQV
jgi:hypothetical protein